MKSILVLMSIFFATASIVYFQYDRPVQSSNSTGQQYVAVDETIWQHSRPDLGDLRLYTGGNEVPYSLQVEQGSSESSQKEIRVLQPGTVGGKTQFFLEMAGLAEYDRVELKLGAKDFVANATTEGADDLHGNRWVSLRRTILYDLSNDNLGNNSTLRLPLTTYKYLRITIDGPVKPADVQGATAGERQEEKAVWRNISGSHGQQQEDRDTAFIFSLPKNVPVERLEFSIDPAQPNFRRQVEIENGKKQWIGSGELSRVHMVRHGQKIDSEQSSIHFHYVSDGETLKVIIHNGDDRPLKITGVNAQQHERRIYFDAAAGQARLYYGDEKLDAPVYDYAKLFQKIADARAAQLGAEETNSAYTGRPDERPWSERHPAVLWVATILAVLILGAMALRSMRKVAA
jgi:uncharacterized protein DUF3999